MPKSTVMIIVFFAFLMIAVSFGIGIWAKKRQTPLRLILAALPCLGLWL